MAKSVDQVLKKYLDRAGSTSAQEAYRNGVNAVTESPMAKAAAADDKFLAKVEESVRSGRRRQALLSKDIASWKAAATGKGAERLASGVRASQDKMRSFLTEFLPYVEQGAQTVRNMPKMTDEDSLARMRAMFEHNKRFRRSR